MNKLFHKAREAGNAILSPWRPTPKSESESAQEGEQKTGINVSTLVDKVTLTGDKIGEAAEGLTHFAGGVTSIGVQSPTILTKAALSFVGIEGKTADDASKWVGNLSWVKIPAAATAAGIGVASWVALSVFDIEPHEGEGSPSLLGAYAKQVNTAYDEGGKHASTAVRAIRDKVKGGAKKAHELGAKAKKTEETVKTVHGRVTEIAGQFSAEGAKETEEQA